MTTWFNYTYGVGIQLNIDCTFNVDRVGYSVCTVCFGVSCSLHWEYILRNVIHSNIHVVRTLLFFYIEESLGIYSFSISSALI